MPCSSLLGVVACRLHVCHAWLASIGVGAVIRLVAGGVLVRIAGRCGIGGGGGACRGTRAASNELVLCVQECAAASQSALKSETSEALSELEERLWCIYNDERADGSRQPNSRDNGAGKQCLLTNHSDVSVACSVPTACAAAVSWPAPHLLGRLLPWVLLAAEAAAGQQGHQQAGCASHSQEEVHAPDLLGA